MKIAIIVSQFNKDITDKLLRGAVTAMRDFGVSQKNYDVYAVPGAFEIPLKALTLIKKKKYDGVVALGCVIEGETDHYEAVCEGTTYGIQKVMLKTGVPILLGILMVKTKSQALARAALPGKVKTNKSNKGYECVVGLIDLLKKDR